MLSIVYRPSTFNEVVGQEYPKLALKAVVINPDKAPRSIILQGGFGCGKTSLARIFAKALNCTDPMLKPCGQCESCKTDLKNSTYYFEFDSSIAGNVDFLRDIRDQFYYAVSGGYRVFVFDEAHLISKKGQSVFLKLLEDIPEKVFILFCSTDADNLLDTIRSRSLELELTTLSDADMTKLILSVTGREGMELGQDIVRLMVRRAGGHSRDAMMLIDRYTLLGEEDFLKSLRILDMEIAELFNLYSKGVDMSHVETAVTRIVQVPCQNLQQDFDHLLLNMADNVYGVRESALRTHAFYQVMKPSFKGMFSYYLTFREKMSTSQDWYVFLLSLKDYFAQKQQSGTADRFVKK